MPASMLKAKKSKQGASSSNNEKKELQASKCQAAASTSNMKSLLKRKNGSNVRGIENMSWQW